MYHHISIYIGAPMHSFPVVPANSSLKTDNYELHIQTLHTHCIYHTPTTETPRSERRRMMMMSDRVGGGPDTRILSNALAEECKFPPSTESSLLGRLNHIDIRLRQLEKQQQQQQQQQQQRRFPPPPENSYFIEDLQARNLACRSFSSALDEVHLKGTLMERLHLLECRIQQLSQELDKDSGAVCSSSAATKQLLASDQGMWLQQIEREMKLQQDNVAPSSTREIGAQLSKLKINKDSRREAAISTTAVEKRANNIRQKEKRRQAHTQLYKKWFPVGC